MAPDERDRSFDKALARHWRSAAPAGEAVNAPAVSGLPDAACPDSETLAAYHERSLFPAQLNSLKEHIIGCAHCQTIRSQLEATDEISLQAAGREEAVAKQPKPVLVAQNLEAARAAEAATPRKSRRVLLRAGSGSLPQEQSRPACLCGLRCMKTGGWLLQVWNKSRSRRTRRLLHRHHPFQPCRRRLLRLRKMLPSCRNPGPMNLPAPMREALQAL